MDMTLQEAQAAVAAIPQRICQDAGDSYSNSYDMAQGIEKLLLLPLTSEARVFLARALEQSRYVGD